MGMAGLMSPTTGPINPVSGGLPSSPGGLISPGSIGAMGGTNPTGSLLGAVSGSATGAPSGLLRGGSINQPFTGNGAQPSLLQGVSTSLNSSSPTGGIVNMSPTGMPNSAAQGASQGFMGTGGVNTTVTPGVSGNSATQGAQAVNSALAPNLGSSATGVASNSGGDINGTMSTLPSTNPNYVNGTMVGAETMPALGTPTGYNLGQGVNTSPASLLPNGAVTPTNLGVQQQVTTPSAQSVVQQNPLTGPTNWNVTPNQTLSGQYAQLMQTGNPAIQAAEQQVIQANALHGGNNDLMAQTAATMQGSQLALQIGAQDAATYANAAQYNASAANAYASQLNQFTANAALSLQNFQQGVAMLNAQTNQQFQLMAAQINAGAYTTSMNLNASLAQTQMSMNATMQTMDKQFTQNLELMQAQGSVASQQAYQQYGMNVRLGYLSSISQQQASLMQTIGMIQNNPNITSTQAQGAVQNAINEFNTFVTQMGAYASAMMPTGTSFPSPSSSSSTSGSSSTPVANSPVPTSPIDPTTWPSMGTPIQSNTGTTTLLPPVSTSSGSYVPSPVNRSRSQLNPNAP